MNDYSLLIVDDEYWARYKIVHQYHWDKIGISKINEAEDGEQAIAFIRKQHVDIVITDMDMPYIDGGALCDWIKMNCPEISVIALSGYSDFPIVRTALKGGAVDYLLKPVSETELFDAVNKVKLSRERSINEKRIALNDEKRHELLTELLYSRTVPKNEDKTLFAIEKGKEYVVAVVRIKTARSADQTKRQKEDKAALIDVICQYLRVEPRRIFCNNNYRFEFLCITERPVKELYDGLDKLCSYLTGSRQISRITAGIGQFVSDIDEISDSYNKLQSFIINSPVKTLPYEIFVYDEKTIIPKNDTDFIRFIEVLNDKGRYEKMIEQISLHYSLESLESRQMTYQELRLSVQQLVYSIFYNDEADRNESFDYSELSTCMKYIYNAIQNYSAEEVRALLVQLFDLEFSSRIDRHLQPSSKTRLMEDVLDYINANYAEQLTLQSIADKFAISPSHLSRSFKKYTDKNLVTYIAQQRINKARQLLLQPDTSVTNVAFDVGYEDYSYFSSIFKKMTGTTPKEYQKNGRGKKEE